MPDVSILINSFMYNIKYLKELPIQKVFYVFI